MSLSRCKEHDKVFIQIGAHLGMFPLVATYRGCQDTSVEPIPAVSPHAAMVLNACDEITNRIIDLPPFCEWFSACPK